MVTLQDIKDMQKDFLKDPKKAIRNLKEINEKQCKDLPFLPIFRGRPDRLNLFLQINREYAKVIGEIWKEQIWINFTILKDHVEGLGIIQRLKEQAEMVKELHQDVNEITALKLGRAYASTCEIFWKKLKRVVYLCGLNPNENQLSIPRLLNCLSELEKKYSLKLDNIKSFVDSTLRNSVDHEGTYFEPPATIVFRDTKKVKPKEIARYSVAEIYEKLKDVHTVILSMHSVENTALVYHLLPWLDLSNNEVKTKIEELERNFV
ncbi:MAG: hypothetical protein Q8Q42_00560 [Nanoarchaeota archaeon]|nr:hypothetical protein [Nanoarchaeota archaeon]